MFHKLTGKLFGRGREDALPAEDGLQIAAPMAGEAVALSKVSDPTFGQGLLGKGAAIIPTDGRVYAPADGVIALMFETAHAVSLVSDSGAEILIHVGLDTVGLKGRYYTPHVAGGDRVKKGELLLEVDIEGVRAAGFDIITPVIICNPDDFAQISMVSNRQVKAMDPFITLKK